jgi:isopentenyl diphosphate isomerase/L-lactate dehydrogenase-like FMN-dependent dehydrogenase
VVFEGTKWEEKIPFPIAMAPVGVLRIFNLDGEMAAIMAAAKRRYPIFQVRQVARVLRMLRGRMEKVE